MNDEFLKSLDKKIDELISLQKHALAIKLNEKGVKQVEIAKHLKVATATVNKMLKGVQHKGA